jgi:mono/diheme cytochrome c family protein
MSENKPRKTSEPKPPRSTGWVAEFSNEHALLEAARKVRDSGYTKTDAFTPFPVHGIDEALGIKPTILPFIVLCAGTTGLLTALLMQWWMNGVDYKYIISGKPFGITPASIPVSFELTILFSAFTSVLGMLALNGLPRLSNPIFTNPRFDRATDDRFFLYVDAGDRYYNRESVKELLSSAHPESLDEVMEDPSPTTLPRPILLGSLLLVLAGLIPAMIVLNMRAGFSDQPRWHVFFDMDFQPKKKPQQTTTIFADGRTMRPQVEGTIARGQLEEQDPFYLGWDPSKVTLAEVRNPILVSTQDPAAQDPAPSQDPAPPSDSLKSEVAAETKPADAATEQKPADPVAVPASQTAAAPAAGAVPNLPWIDRLPIAADEEHMKLGKTKYEIYCSTCHGYSGFGDGLVAQRAASLLQDTWTPPSSLHLDRVQKQPVGQIFHTISKGQGKMASYASSLTPKERWAIVLYVKALQRSRNATIEDVPVEQRSKLSESK